MHSVWIWAALIILAATVAGGSMFKAVAFLIGSVLVLAACTFVGFFAAAWASEALDLTGLASLVAWGVITALLALIVFLVWAKVES